MAINWFEAAEFVFGSLPDWLVYYKQMRGKKPIGEAAVEVIKQKSPDRFGFSRVDEQIFETLRQILPAMKRTEIDTIVGAMKDYEKVIFRLTVCGMSAGSQVVTERVKNPPKGAPKTATKTVAWENTRKDLRVQFLLELCKEFETLVTNGMSERKAAGHIVRAMRKRQLITRSPLIQKAIDTFSAASEWVENEILSFFGVPTLGDITLAIFDQKVGAALQNVAGKIPVVPAGQVNQGFWASALRKNWLLTVGLIIILVAIIVKMAR